MPPAAYAWLPCTVPDPAPWTRVSASTDPSPQSTIAECVSSTPISVKFPLTLTGSPSCPLSAKVASLANAWITGSTLWTISGPETSKSDPRSSSLIWIVTVKRSNGVPVLGWSSRKSRDVLKVPSAFTTSTVATPSLQVALPMNVSVITPSAGSVNVPVTVTESASLISAALKAIAVISGSTLLTVTLAPAVPESLSWSVTVTEMEYGSAEVPEGLSSR